MCLTCLYIQNVCCEKAYFLDTVWVTKCVSAKLDISNCTLCFTVYDHNNKKTRSEHDYHEFWQPQQMTHVGNQIGLQLMIIFIQ